jgi:beta-glucosidase
MLGTWLGEGKEEDVVTVLEGLKTPALSGCRINYAKGCEVVGDSTAGFEEAIKAANESDVVIMAIGETEELNGEAHSRTSIDLPAIQRQLVQEIQKTGKPVVVLLFAGRPLTINWLYENMPSILLAWHPGVQAGTGIVDVLFGDYNPSGKVTFSFPRNVGQIPIYYNYKNTGRPAVEDDRYTSKYIDSPNTPLIPFGHGLSYTTFEYSNLQLDKKQLSIPGSVTITADIKNTGTRKGQEIVQLYIRDLVGSVTRPVKELKGFKKILLEQGQTKKVTFVLTTDDLKFHDINMEYNVEPGDFKVWVGPSSAEGLEGAFELQ